MEKWAYEENDEEGENKVKQRIYDLKDRILDIVPHVKQIAMENEWRVMIYVFIFYEE